ncbi:hypothetical protein HK099_007801 [Clydaea vesicula]|uniref:LIM zinc-binding domain-containing protein n=1 Tax=Clydaea vesicula TaxID=447962 RepID=A0AAD5XY92_9FUNG|nr:hypothetical protein HK099_007801 [Clydaea vesicula]
MVNCPRCSKAVYAAEQVTGPNATFYHKSCMSCKECRKKLDSTTMTERENEVYCKSCYGKLFGPKGYGYGGGAGTLSTDSTVTVTPVPASSTESNYIATSPNTNFTNTSKAAPTKNSNSNLSNATKYGGASDKCPKCDKSVYFAEQALGPGGTKCSDCNKSVDSTTMADKDNVLYCKPCHGKKFGPKGYGYGGGAGVLNTERAG